MKKLLVITVILLLVQCSKNNIPAEQYVVAQKGLYLRNEPSQKAKTVTVVPFKSKVKVIDSQDEQVVIDGIEGYWCRVRWNSQEGWAFGGYLKPQVHYEQNIFLYEFFHIENSSLPAESEGGDTVEKYMQSGLPLTYLTALPDIIAEGDVVIVDKKSVYTDIISDVKIEFDGLNGGWLCNFKYKSGRRYDQPVIFRKSYYDRISKTMPVKINMKTVDDREISDSFYRKIGTYRPGGGEQFSLTGIPYIHNPMKDEEIVRKNFYLTIYDLSGSAARSYLAILETSSSECYDQILNSLIIMSSDRIIHAYNGHLQYAFTAGNITYVFFWYISSNSGDNAMLLFTSRDGIISLEAVDGTYAN